MAASSSSPRLNPKKGLEKEVNSESKKSLVRKSQSKLHQSQDRAEAKPAVKPKVKRQSPKEESTSKEEEAEKSHEQQSVCLPESEAIGSEILPIVTQEVAVGV